MAENRTRYDNLFDALRELRARNIRYLHYLEVGTYDGARARKLLDHWIAIGGVAASYYGFDLFEDMTEELSRAELSKAKLPPPVADVRRRLEDVRRKRVTPYLYPGNTREMLPKIVPRLPMLDLIFLDGGHSLETVASDWAALAPAVRAGTIALLDDYYENRDDYGCGPLVRSLAVADPAEFRVALLDPVDRYEHTGVAVRMARVSRA